MLCRQVAIATILLVLLIPVPSAALIASSDATKAFQLAATLSASAHAVEEAPSQQQILFNKSGAPIIVVSAVLPAHCACRLGIHDVQDDGSQPPQVSWTRLLTTNVITGVAHADKYVLNIDCSGAPAATQRCHAKPQQLLLANVAGEVAATEGGVQASGSGVVEAVIHVTASPSAYSENNSSGNDLQSGAANDQPCGNVSKTKWTLRAALIVATAGLTFAAI